VNQQPQRQADMRLYLVVHETLRRILARFVAATERLEPAVLADVIPERWALFARGLHQHHEGEDTEFFPMIAKASPDQVPLIEQLEREHRELVGRLEAVDVAMLSLEGDPSDATKKVLHDSISAVRDQLVPHLDIEDEKLLPAAAVSVDPEEWDRAGEEALKATPRADMPVVAGALDETVRSLPPEQQPPPPPFALRMMLTLSWRRRYAKFTEPLDG
jgi:hemerythrin-like domain-containing protein